MKKVPKPTQKLLLNISKHNSSHSTKASPKNLLNKFSIASRNQSKSSTNALSPRIPGYNNDTIITGYPHCPLSKSPRSTQTNMSKSPSIYFLKGYAGSNIDKENNRNTDNTSTQSKDIQKTPKNTSTSTNTTVEYYNNLNHKQRDCTLENSKLIMAEPLKHDTSPYLDSSRRPSNNHSDALLNSSKIGTSLSRNGSYLKINQLAPTPSMSSLSMKKNDYFDNDELLLPGMKNDNNIQSTTKLSLGYIINHEKIPVIDKRKFHEKSENSGKTEKTEKTLSLKIDLSIHGALSTDFNNSKNQKNSSELLDKKEDIELDRSCETSIRIDSISVRNSDSNLNSHLMNICDGMNQTHNSNGANIDEGSAICNMMVKPNQMTHEDDHKKYFNVMATAINLKEDAKTNRDIVNNDDSDGFKLAEDSQNSYSDVNYSMRVSICQNDHDEDNLKTNEIQHRKEEISNFIKKVIGSINEMRRLEESMVKERNKTQLEYRNAFEDLEELTKRLIDIIRDQKESQIVAWNLEHNKELLRFQECQRQLMGFSKDAEEMKGDIEEHLDNIIHNIDHKPYQIIMEKYQDKLNNYSKFTSGFENNLLYSASSFGGLRHFGGLSSNGSTDKNANASKFSNKISEYRQKMKIIFQEILDNQRYEYFKSPLTSDQYLLSEVKFSSQDHINNNQFNKMRKFEDFLKSEEDEININKTLNCIKNNNKNIYHHNNCVIMILYQFIFFIYYHNCLIFIVFTSFLFSV